MADLFTLGNSAAQQLADTANRLMSVGGGLLMRLYPLGSMRGGC